jgi:predicted GNAT family N-acyltransferase
MPPAASITAEGSAATRAVESAAVHVDVEQVPVFLVLPLRQRVLRPHQSVSEVGFDGDAAGTHFAAFDASSAIVGVVSLIGEPPDERGTPSWRLRGMATEPALQRQGVGRALMSGLLDFVARSGGGALWCNARLPAVGFYELFGFVQTGEVFEEPNIGPHVRMARVVEPSPDDRSPDDPSPE